MTRGRIQLPTLTLALLILVPSVLWALDFDGDGLSNALEVSIGTDVGSPDTDGDKLSDYEEYHKGVDGYRTNPLKEDSDSDGLSDYEEVFEFGTNPNLSDTDGDGAWDVIDGVPTGYPDLAWNNEFQSGLVHLNPEVEVYSLRGLYAERWAYHWLPGKCVFEADRTASATMSSKVTNVTVVEAVNDALRGGENEALQALNAKYVRSEDPHPLDMVYGDCSFFIPRYKIGYAIDRSVHEVWIKNSAPLVVSDPGGFPYWYAHLNLPVEPGTNQSFSLQIHLASGIGLPGPENREIPGFAFSIFANEHFIENDPLLESVVPSIDLGGNIYQVNLRIDTAIANSGHAPIGSDRPEVVVVAIPVWIDTEHEKVSRSLDPSAFNMVAANHRHTSHAYEIVAKQGLNISDVRGAIPLDTVSLASGSYEFGAFSVCIMKSPNSDNCGGLASIDAIVIVSESMTSLQQIEADIEWGDPGSWFGEEKDEFGNVLRTFAAFLDVLEIDRQIFGKLVASPMSASDSVQSTETRLTLIHVRENLHGEKIFSTHRSQIQKESRWENDASIKKTSLHWRTQSAGTTQDPGDSEVLGKLGKSFAYSLKGAKVGTVLVSNGRAAWLAYMEGNEIQGTLFLAKGGVDTFSEVVGNKTLGTLGVGVKILQKVPAAKLAKIVLGVLTNAYALSKIAMADSEFEKHSLTHQASISMMDFIFAVVMGFGAVYLGWTIGVAIAYTILPNDLAARIMSSPVSFVVFVWTHYFTNEIPREIAEDALNEAIRTAAGLAQAASDSGNWAVVVEP